ncbi:MAG TPA: FAD-dependent oxidoreductase [Alphaproteobacteria bacterium]|nr:FAD-dependent oxidoreductase [Alphaproteobacteria bacterium]
MACLQSGTRAQTSVRKGGIAVDEHIQTTKAGVYAAGDVTGRDEDAGQQSDEERLKRKLIICQGCAVPGN